MLEYTYILHYINASGGIRMKKSFTLFIDDRYGYLLQHPLLWCSWSCKCCSAAFDQQRWRRRRTGKSVFYKNALAVLNSKKGFVVVENDKLTAVIDAAKVGNKVPSAATLEKLLKMAMLTSLSLFSWTSWMTKLSIPAKSANCKSTCKAMQLLTTSSPVKLMSTAFTATKPFLKLWPAVGIGLMKNLAVQYASK